MDKTTSKRTKNQFKNACRNRHTRITLQCSTDISGNTENRQTASLICAFLHGFNQIMGSVS